MQYAADFKDQMITAPRTASSFVKRRWGYPALALSSLLCGSRPSVVKCCHAAVVLLFRPASLAFHSAWVLASFLWFGSAQGVVTMLY